LQQAAEWILRALKDEDFPLLLCGRSALDYQGEYTGSEDVDILIGTDFRGALSVLDVYVDRGDLFPAGAVPGSVVRYLVSGDKPVDVMNVSSVHSGLFSLLMKEASATIGMGSAGQVRAVSREGYFVLSVMIGLKGFAKEKEDPMLKVREAWVLFGTRTDRAKVDRILRKLGVKKGLETALEAR
jgi:hypothetical protein